MSANFENYREGKRVLDVFLERRPACVGQASAARFKESVELGLACCFLL